LIGFEDLLGSLLGFPTAVCVTVFVILIGGTICFGNIFLYSEFEKIWLSLPIIVFLAFGMASLVVSYTSIGNAEEIVICLISSQ
jgi:type IV secretory pathway VirB2 component (pilin)